MKKISSRNLFLIDASGALLTAYLLSQVLTTYQVYFAMPIEILHYLALAAFIFFVYSLSCFLRTPKNPGLFLKLIAIANGIYVLVTYFLIIDLWGQLTWLGAAYFIAEGLIITYLAWVEWNWDGSPVTRER